MKATARNFLAVVFGLTLSAGAHADAGLDPYKYFFNETFGDYSEELAHARDQGKLGVMMFFELDDCPFCHRMKETVLNQPEVQEYFRKHFLLYAVDIEGDVEMKDFKGQTRTMKDWAETGNRVRATPVFQFYDLEGNPTARYTGATGNVEEFMWLGEYVVQGRYKEKDMSFTKYKREKRGEK